MDLWSYEELVPLLNLAVVFYIVAIICYVVLIIKAKKLFFFSFFSLICVFFYYTPWLIQANREMLGLFIISFLWFLIAWIIVIIRLIIKLVKKNLDKHEIFSLIIVGLCYIVMVITWCNGIFVTV